MSNTCMCVYDFLIVIMDFSLILKITLEIMCLKLYLIEKIQYIFTKIFLCNSLWIWWIEGNYYEYILTFWYALKYLSIVDSFMITSYSLVVYLLSFIRYISDSKCLLFIGKISTMNHIGDWLLTCYRMIFIKNVFDTK